MFMVRKSERDMTDCVCVCVCVLLLILCRMMITMQKSGRDMKLILMMWINK